MKKVLSILLTLILIVMTWSALPMAALAATAPDMEVSYTPTSLASAGDISITVRINNNETPLENAILTIGDDQMADFGTIEANAVQEQTYSYHVSESELGNDIQVILEYVTEGTQKRVTRTIQVAQQELSVDVYAQGEVSQTTVPVGTQVEFVFTVENRGDAEITNVEVSAPGVNRGNPIEGTFSLAPGESRILSYTGEIVRNMTIEPVITYTANGRNYTEELETMRITVSELYLSVQISASSSEVESGQSVDIRVQLTNEGNADIENLVLYDSNDDRVPLETSTLGQGESISVTRSITINERTDIGFYARGDDANGTTHTFNSNVITVDVTAAEESPTASPTETPGEGDGPLTMEATVERPTDGSNNFRFNIEITNTGSAYTDAVLSERSLGNIQTIGNIPTGTTTVTCEKEVTEDSEFTFELTATDADGNPVTIQSETLQVSLSSETVDDPANSPSTISTLMIIIVIVIVLIIGVGITLIVLVKKEKKKKAQAEAAKNARRTTQNGAARRPDGSEPTRGPRYAIDDEEQDGEPGQVVAGRQDDVPHRTTPGATQTRPIQQVRKPKKTTEFDDRNLF